MTADTTPPALADWSDGPVQTVQLRPEGGAAPAQLMLLLHGWGADADDMLGLAGSLRATFPQALWLLPQGFEAAPGTPGGRQWFPRSTSPDDPQRAPRAEAAADHMARWVAQAQVWSGVGPQATALFGFSQGATVALAVAERHDGRVGRVLAFSGRYARLPDHAPQATTIHLFHGEADDVIPAQHQHEALARLAELEADATADLASDIGHELHPALIDCARHRLTHHVPLRIWQAALSAAPPGHIQ